MTHSTGKMYAEYASADPGDAGAVGQRQVLWDPQRPPGHSCDPQTGAGDSEEGGVWVKVEVPPTPLTAVVFSVFFYLYKHQGMSHSQLSVPVLPGTKPSPTLFAAVSEMGHGPSQAWGCREEEEEEQEQHTSSCCSSSSHGFEPPQHPGFSPIPHTSLCRGSCRPREELGTSTQRKWGKNVQAGHEEEVFLH